MDEYLLAGALLALLVLLWGVRGRRRRLAQRDQPAESTLAAPSRLRSWRKAPPQDSTQFSGMVMSDEYDNAQRADREAAQEAVRIEGDREAAEWEARLVAEQLAHRAEEQARLATDSELDARAPLQHASNAQAAAERSEPEALDSLQRSYDEVAPLPLPSPSPAGIVWIADASKVVRVKTRRLLEQHGWQTTLATDGMLALEQILRAAPHALITEKQVQQWLKARHGRPLFLIDIAVPIKRANERASMAAVAPSASSRGVIATARP